jgi:hypothetical protein
MSAPNYAGDIKIAAIQGSQQWWPAIAVWRLPNGIHGVQCFANGTWFNATMDSRPPGAAMTCQCPDSCPLSITDPPSSPAHARLLHSCLRHSPGR